MCMCVSVSINMCVCVCMPVSVNMCACVCVHAYMCEYLCMSVVKNRRKGISSVRRVSAPRFLSRHNKDLG